MRKNKPLKSEEDAFGQMLWAYYKGKEVFEIWERDDGYISASSSARAPILTLTSNEIFLHKSIHRSFQSK